MFPPPNAPPPLRPPISRNFQSLMTPEELERLRVLQFQGGDANQLWVSPRQGRRSLVLILFSRAHRSGQVS